MDSEKVTLLKIQQASCLEHNMHLNKQVNLFQLLKYAPFGKTIENFHIHCSIQIINKWDDCNGGKYMIASSAFGS